MVAAVSGAASITEPQNPKTSDEHSRRLPLLPSEMDNSNGVPNNQRKPKSRVVSSRYMSPSTSTSTSNSSSVSSSSSSSRRYPSPLISRNSTPVPNAHPTGPKRSVSVDRRRPSVRPAAARPLIPDLDAKNCNGSEISNATKLLVTSTRSLSVSFQGEAFSLPVSKTKAAAPSPNLSSVRKGTPERRRGKVDGGGGDQHRWPARNRVANPKPKLNGSGNAIRTLQQLMSDERRPSLDGRLSLDFGNSELLKAIPRDNNEFADVSPSDTDSVSSDSTSEFGGGSRNGPHGTARFWQETNGRLRRLHQPGSPISTSPSAKLIVPPNLRRYSVDGPISSPARGGIRPAGLSPSRGHSPSRIRNAVSTINNSFTETPSVLSFAVDVRRGKVGENRIVDAHMLRLLYNRNLQWRFVNARAEAVLLVQKHTAEKNLWNAWIAISDIRDTVTKKRHRLQLLRQKLKLASILKAQMSLLEDWGCLEKDHSMSLLGAIEALKASTLRLPVGGAIANVVSLKDAIGSAFDVLHGMASSIHLLLPTVEEMNTLVTEIANVSAKEQALLKQCTDFISLLADMQVQDSSLRTHIIQRNSVPSD